jgi:hypothetical protein
MGPHVYTYPTVIELRRVGFRTDGRELSARAVHRQPVRPAPALPAPQRVGREALARLASVPAAMAGVGFGA